MTKLVAFISRHRIASISIFAFAFPLFAALVRNLFWRQMDPVSESLANNSSQLHLMVQLLVYFLPGVITFFWLPIKPRGKLLASVRVIALAYIAVMASFTLLAFTKP